MLYFFQRKLWRRQTIIERAENAIRSGNIIRDNIKRVGSFDADSNDKLIQLILELVREIPAASFARANGLTTLEMTRAGKNLSKLTKGMPWEQAGPMWQRLSAVYAKGAIGSVHVFQNATTGIRLIGVWRRLNTQFLMEKIL